jgi:hypothetical protein
LLQLPATRARATIIATGKSLSLTVVGQGVEKRDQATKVTYIGERRGMLGTPPRVHIALQTPPLGAAHRE